MTDEAGKENSLIGTREASTLGQRHGSISNNLNLNARNVDLNTAVCIGEMGHFGFVQCPLLVKHDPALEDKEIK